MSGRAAGGGTQAAQFSRWGLGRRSTTGQTARDETHVAFGRRSIPAEPRRYAPLIVAFRSEYTGYSSLTRLVSRAPRPHRENWPASALTWVPPPAVHRAAARRSSLRFGRNTPGIPPSRALSAGRLAPTGRTGRPRRSRGFHHRLFTASLRAAHRCVSVGIHRVFLPHAPCQPGASPASALTRVPPPATGDGERGGLPLANRARSGDNPPTRLWCGGDPSIVLSG